MRNGVLWLAWLALMPAATAVASEPFPINSTATGNQRRPSIAVLPEGFVVVWDSDVHDGSSHGVVGRVFNRDGAALTGEFVVNQYTAGSQNMPMVAADDDGDFVVAWQSDGQDGDRWGVYARRYSAAGDPLDDEFPVNTTIAGSQRVPSVTVAGAGDFVIAWLVTNAGGQGGVRCRRFNLDGSPASGEIEVTPPMTTSFYGQTTSVAMLANGGFVVAYDLDLEVYARIFDDMGQAVGDAVEVSTDPYIVNSLGSVHAHGAGAFIVTWKSQNNLTVDYHFASRFTDTGTPIWVVETAGGEAWGGQGFSVAAAGEFVSAWTDYYSIHLFASPFDATGAPLTDTILIHSDFPAYHFDPDAAHQSSEPLDFVVVWSQGDDLYGRRQPLVFEDGFESGDTSAWTSTSP